MNLINPGQNYDWPLMTLGTEYEMFDWPIDHTVEPEQVFQAPAFAWVPSIGTSSLTSIDGGNFTLWQGDLMVASLREMSLFRVRIEEDRPILIEPIPVYERIRDIFRDGQGRIILWTDNGNVGLLRDRSK